ncbi:MAG TPA: prenyltransferase/squalene oxidase repeat-containing protein [Bryobacteraceae bacterium]|nr:prenyltransferase/squalene oxidase repeat-containing protein [Bryobacteraceae bacterium]
MIPGAHSAEALVAGAAEATRRAAEYLLSLRGPDGAWECPITAGAPLETDLILLELWRHPPQGGAWTPPNPGRIERAIRNVLARHLPDGGIAIYPHGPAELNATVKAYFALKAAGVPGESTAMRAACECVLRLGGLHRTSAWVKIELGLFGLYDDYPAVPPEMILLPGGFDSMPYWMRMRAIPLAVLTASKQSRRVPDGFNLRELAAGHESGSEQVIGAGRFAPLMRLAGRYPIQPIRARALRECGRWMAEHRPDESYTAMRYALMAMDAAIYPRGHADSRELEEQIERLVTDDGERLSLRPCRAEVLDTALALFALGEAGTEAPECSVEWLMAQDASPESADVTALELLALMHSASSKRQDAVALLVRTQAKDGGWPADESCPDTTGRVLEALCRAGKLPPDHSAVRRGVDYLLRSQELDGSWSGRWGVSYVYGAFLALRGLAAAGVDEREACVLRGGEWLRSVQNPDGGWGESCASYDGHGFVAAPSTASQTAWAVAGLIAGGDMDSMSVRSGIEWLAGRQRAGGGWDEDVATATEIPREQYLARHSYGQAYPLVALAAYNQACRGGAPARSSR